MNGTQRRTLVSPWRIHCTYHSMPKGTSPAEAMSNSGKIKPVALAIIKLRWSEDMRQLVSYVAENSIIFFNSMEIFESISGRSESLFGLSLPNQYCPIIVWENLGWFSGDFTLWAMPTSWSSLLWTTIVVYDNRSLGASSDAKLFLWHI